MKSTSKTARPAEPRLPKHLSPETPERLDDRGDYGAVAWSGATLTDQHAARVVLEQAQLRKVVLWHTLLSYFLGAVVLACTINLVSGLAG